jgi:cell filamentation protein
MIIEGNDAFDDPCCYPGTTVLKNLLNIQGQNTLDAFEVEISTLRSEEPLPEGNFDAAHYCQMHHHLFQDVYEWAGQYRTVRISKGGSAFCYPEYIPAQMDTLFQGLHGGGIFMDSGLKAFLEEIGLFLSELNAIHPFREGNGGSQLALIGLLGAAFVGHPFAFERLDRNTFLPAMITSYFGHREPLILELRNLLI